MTYQVIEKGKDNMEQGSGTLRERKKEGEMTVGRNPSPSLSSSHSFIAQKPLDSQSDSFLFKEAETLSPNNDPYSQSDSSFLKEVETSRPTNDSSLFALTCAP